MKSRISSVVLGLLAGVLALTGTTSAVGSDQEATGPAGMYRNPLLKRDFPDPDVIKAGHGWYYAYSTNSDPTSGHINIQAAKSRDLVHWRYLGEVMPELPAWGDEAVVSWAPDVVRHHGRYYLYYSIVPDRLVDDFGLCLAVATSRSPAGPFVTTNKPLYCGPTLSDIDSHVFHDPATGRWLMYWGSGGDIVTTRLAPSLTRVATPGADPKLLLRGWSSPIQRPYEHGIEGPFVIARHGWYYLFYSGNNCCSYPPHYATMVARSRQATGPYHRIASVRPGKSSVILHDNKRWAGPGHNSVIRDSAGQDWIVYHAIDNLHPYLPGGDYVRRPMLIDRMRYEDGWPVVRQGTPSVGWMKAPVTD